MLRGTRSPSLSSPSASSSTLTSASAVNCGEHHSRDGKRWKVIDENHMPPLGRHVRPKRWKTWLAQKSLLRIQSWLRNLWMIRIISIPFYSKSQSSRTRSRKKQCKRRTSQLWSNHPADRAVVLVKTWNSSMSRRSMVLSWFKHKTTHHQVHLPCGPSQTVL